MPQAMLENHHAQNHEFPTVQSNLVYDKPKIIPRY